MKKTSVLLISLLLILTACGNKDEQQKSTKEQESQSDSSTVKHIATDKNVQGDDYRTILPFKESQARGMLQQTMANGYNGDDFEDGLLEQSKTVFPTDEYLYQDGQFLDKKTINAYLGPKYTKSEIEKMDKDEKEEKNANENLGLNPSRHGEKDEEKIAENSPAYLSNILEQDFYGNSDTKGKKIKGMTIGLAMNSEYYYQKEKDGPTFSKKLDRAKVEKEGKKMADEMLQRLREHKALKNIPIHFAIYIQSGENDIIPGEFVAGATADDGQTRINSWKDINEKSVLLPSSEAADLNENLNNNFKQFNDNLQSYFPNFTQAVGKTKFDGKNPKNLIIEVPIDYYGKAELTGITQFIAQQADKYFSNIDAYEIHIKDGNQARALITKGKDDKKQNVHIYKR